MSRSWSGVIRAVARFETLITHLKTQWTGYTKIHTSTYYPRWRKGVLQKCANMHIQFQIQIQKSPTMFLIIFFFFIISSSFIFIFIIFIFRQIKSCITTFCELMTEYEDKTHPELKKRYLAISFVCFMLNLVPLRIIVLSLSQSLSLFLQKLL